ncbi:MAG: DNA polymerase [bacterium]|nr:DNA polymerase [bacterium]
MNEFIKKAEGLGIKIPRITADKINNAVKPVLRKMEKAGIRIDVAVFKKLENALSNDLEILTKKIHKLAGHDFNISSPSQMAVVLFEELKLQTEGLKKSQSGFSTAANELKKIEDKHKIIPLILEYREISKLISTYLKPLPLLVDENSRLHTTYGLETSTGRINSNEPNLQNIPIRGKYGEKIRGAFVAEKGMKLISADYSQIELRVVACLAQDETMIRSFKNGEDIHAQTAAEIFGIKMNEVTPDQRRKAKAVNFGIVYGQTPYGLSQALSIPIDEAALYIKNYFSIHTGIAKYVNSMIDLGHEQGYVETLFGTRRHLPNLKSHIRFMVEADERIAINTPVQGTAAEILKLAMVELDKVLSTQYTVRSDRKPQLLLTVHDELVVEAPVKQAKEVAELVQETMENVVTLCVPIEVNISMGNNWAEAK